MIWPSLFWTVSYGVLCFLSNFYCKKKPLINSTTSYASISSSPSRRYVELVEFICQTESEFVKCLDPYIEGIKAGTVKYYVGVDVGATNTRIALMLEIFQGQDPQAQDNVIFHNLCVLKFTDVTSMSSLVGHFQYLGDLIVKSVKVESSGGCIAVAGPLEEGGDAVTITNYQENDRYLHKKQLPSSLFGSHVSFLNDLEACCYGILSIGKQGKFQEFFKDGFSSPTTTTFSSSEDPDDRVKKIHGELSEKEKSVHHGLKKINYCVVAMGTGLGTGVLHYQKNSRNSRLLLQDKQNRDLSKEIQFIQEDGEFIVIPLEGGHCKATYPGRKSDDKAKDIERLDFLSMRCYDSRFTIEMEDICSGRGLQACYEFETKQYPSKLKANDIAKLAIRQEDPHAEQAMLAHYRYLMKAAQNIMIMTNCKGVFFVGDNQVDNGEFFVRHRDVLKFELSNHVKFSWLENIDAYRQIKPYNFNLEGTFYYLKQNHSSVNNTKL